ncbi:hypothetical protein EUGRSUZ_L03309 [Eucalyptus grandis]|uniref:non-specific serine/threonine protein kinase n=1 Tax=Eucalyptus grandis TaxID=71139 RepID=A0AAD9WIE5_EUCGR|nr:hypothetical protein EUGRSUZ_L03309 [Eucalyptus grandis]
MKAFVALSMCLVLFTCNALVSNALDTITTNQSIQDGESLISAGETFELGFFSRGDPPKRHLGIWHFEVTTHGSLVLLDGNGNDIWLSNAPIPVRNPVAQLLDSGNLVVRDAEGSDPNNFLWQSFDYPTDTLVAGMKLGRNRRSGFNRYLTSWKSIDDPSPGNFTFQLDPNGYPQELLKQGSDIKFRTGPWNGLRWSGTPFLNPNPYYGYEFVLNEEEMYFRYELLNRSRFAWIDRTQGWMLYMASPTDQCDNYASCGAYGSCRVDTSPVCRCLKGFVPRFSQEWDMLDWSNGCVRRNPLDCEKDIFVKYSWLKLPDTRSSWFNESMNLQECKVVCMKNCSCMAYSSLDIRNGGSGCLLWFGELIDIRGYGDYGQDLYIRMAVSESALLPSHQKKHKLVMGLAVSFGSVFLILVLIICVLQCKKKKVKLPADPTQREQLDWSARFNIINGIARGLLYLHQDSRLRIIHRDIKASNVLLDCDMNPKISDFGLAKSLAGNETRANTNRVVGTYGYMSPEYALDGVFSTKSDVFSYGVLVLEIVSGKRNRGFHHPDHHHNLLGHAWRLFTEGRSMQLLDKLVQNSCSTSEALRSIHIGLLCVQRCPNDRPSMSTVVMMLGSDIELPLPKEPGFFNERNLLQENPSQSQPNEITMTLLSAR